MQYEYVRDIVAAFEAEGVRYVVSGGVALNLLGLARATQGLDVFVEPTAENIERVKGSLRIVFDDPDIDQITAEDLLGDYPAVQYAPPPSGFHIDILTRLGEAFRFEDLEAAPIAFEGVDVPVGTPRMLFRMKRDTIRPRDRADAAALRARFGLEDD